MMRLFSSQRLITLSPLFVRSPTPCFPLSISLFLLLDPTLVLWSSSKSRMSCCGTSSTVTCSQVVEIIHVRFICIFYGGVGHKNGVFDIPCIKPYV